jgi:hypothetical protein
VEASWQGYVRAERVEERAAIGDEPGDDRDTLHVVDRERVRTEVLSGHSRAPEA